MARGLVVGFVVAVTSAVVWGSPAHAQSSIGLEGGLYFDSATLTDERRIGPSGGIERADVKNRDVGLVALYYLHALDERYGFRLGGELRYLGTLAVEEDDDPYVLGTAIELGARGEWSTPLADALSFVVALRASFALVFPSGDLAEAIDDMAAQGVPVGHGPRPGVTLMPSLGARYAIHERVNAGLSLGLGWTFVSLFDVDERVSGIDFLRATTLSSTRFEITIGLEVSL